jgi:hypothetical protein
MSKFEVAKTVIDKCNTDIIDISLLENISRAEHVSECLNSELSAYGLKTFVSPDKTSVLIDDQGMSQVINYFQGTGYQPVITEQHVERVKNIIQSADKEKIPLLWSQAGFKKRYYNFKQVGFNGANLLNILNLNTLNTVGATLSPTGSVALTLSGVIGLSWTGSLFFSTLENYIPNDFVKTKAVVKGTKLVLAVPIRLVEHTTNVIFGTAENYTIGVQLPINVTDKFNVADGPRIKDIKTLRKPVGQFLYKFGKRHFPDAFK